MILIIIKKSFIMVLLKIKQNNLGNYIEGTFKKFPSTNFTHSPTHSRGLQYLLLISPDHFFFLFSFPKFQRLLNLQT